MSLHIGAEQGQIAEIVLLPGDPLRAEFAAKTFLTDPVCYNTVRGMLGYTGTWKGTQVSIQGSGMGIPSLSIYATELIREYGATTLIRIGSCGSYQSRVKVRDLVIAMTACTDSAQNKIRFSGMDYAPCADYSLFSDACRLAVSRSLAFHAGPIVSSDTFYQDDPNAWMLWAEYGVLAVEMETSALYTLAARYGTRALAICTVSDSLVSGETMSSEDRETSLGEMIELALDTATKSE
ncbi:MAG: purine-nucleoside phosphorylase [Spirochaetales bacterium]|nr:MAG: purine-nucleoside phosphorylase [Spirochaetales bacterium]